MKTLISALILFISTQSLAIEKAPTCHDAGLKQAVKWQAHIKEDITRKLKKILIDAFAAEKINLSENNVELGFDLKFVPTMSGAKNSGYDFVGRVGDIQVHTPKGVMTQFYFWQISDRGYTRNPFDGSNMAVHMWLDDVATPIRNKIGEQTGWVCKYSLHADANGYISNKNDPPPMGSALGSINHYLYSDEIEVQSPL